MSEKTRMTTEDIVTAMVPAITRAVIDAINKHAGRLPATLERAALICAEEVGELAEAVLVATRDTPISKEQYEALEQNIINENMDVIAAGIIFVMVNSGACPVSSLDDDDQTTVDFDVDPKMKVM